MPRFTLAPLFAIAVPLAVAAAELPKRYTETVTNKDGKRFTFEMVLIPGGKFVMGAESEKGRKPHEAPQHEVEIKPFYLCTTETTHEAFMAFYDETHQKVKGLDPGRGDPVKEAEEARKPPPVDAITGPTPLTHVDLANNWGGGKRPVIQITWFDAMIFCKWIWQKTGKHYRLPTEAEWEHACRAGAKTAYFFGDDPAQLEDHAWFEDNSDDMIQEVGKKKPNPWGLYDTLGNVMEWVLDFYSPATYAENAKGKPAVSPEGPAKGTVHVARGGAYLSSAGDLRCAARGFEELKWR
jgi:formylglycine-generating enzyme required for sulfatase activity